MKDPAFLFYPNDWLGGTLGMSFEEKGAYMELLMLQFNRGHMEGHMCGQVVGQIWDKIRNKFIQDDKGLWFNERLELEKNKRKSFTDSRKNNLKGENQHTKKRGHTTSDMGGHTTSRMEDENENTSFVINNKDKQYSEQCITDELWVKNELEKSGMRFPTLKNKMEEFMRHKISTGKIAHSLRDFKSHWSNWYRSQKPSMASSMYQNDPRGTQG